MNQNKRDHFLHVRVNHHEYQVLGNLIESEGKSQSEILRVALREAALNRGLPIEELPCPLQVNEPN